MQGLHSLPALGLAIAAAAFAGVQLGESAIAEIDPAHFRGPAIHPRDRGAAIDPDDVNRPEPRFASFYGWEDGAAARAIDCGGCEAVAARDAYVPRPELPPLYEAHEAAVEAVADRREWAAEALDEAERELADIEDRIEWVEVEVYSSYPVTAEEAERRSFRDDPYPAGGL